MLGFEASLEEVTHLQHVGRGVLEEVLISIAQGVKPFLASACGGKTVLGTLAPARKEILALATIAGKTIAFLYAETEELGLTL